MLSLEETRTILNRAQADPVWWAREVLGCDPWPVQEQILESIRDNERTAARSCHGAGKSWIAARAALWFSFSFPYSIVATTAPTFRQVQRIIWQEMRRAYTGAKFPLGGRMLTTEWMLDDQWYAFGFATNDPDSFQGIHAKDVLVIFDEASGIDKDIWTAADGVLSSEHCRFLSIGNPTDPTAEFAKECAAPGVSKLKISAFDTPNFTAFGITEDDIERNTWEQKIAGPLPYPALVTPKWVADRYRRWGLNSPMYQARVRAEFPEAGDDTLISLSLVEAAMQRKLEPSEPHQLGVDVARFGRDSTVIVERKGPVARVKEKHAKEDTMQTTGRVVVALTETGAKSVNVDVIGIGAGVVDRLQELEKPVTGINVGESPKDKERFLNARAELYWGLRERFESGDIDIDDEDTAAQLSALKYKIDSRGRIVIESKDEMKRRDLPSPDEADAHVLAFADSGSGFFLV